MRLFPRKIWGLRLGRLREWLAVLRDNRQPPGVRGWASMAWLALTADIRYADPENRSNYAKCARCPIHDRTFKRCGANDGVGCNCYMPYAIATGKACWLREREPDSPWGYGKSPGMKSPPA